MLYQRLTGVTLLIILQALLTACGPVTIRDTDNQLNIPIQDWQLVLHRGVTIPANRTRIFLQNGRLVYGINEFEPHCQIRVKTIAEHTQTIAADQFRIERVFGTEDQVVTSGRIRLAANGGMVMAGGGNGNGESRIIYLYFLTLKSDKQPQVSFLVCGGLLDEPPLADYPSVQDIRRSLGDVAELIIPGEG